MANHTDALLRVEDLTKHFPVREGALGTTRGRLRAVEGVSFTIRRGETLGLVGESGCGKSTTGRALLRLIEPTSGKVYFGGRDVLSLDDRDLRSFRREAQIVFQDPFSSLNPRMTVGAMLEEALAVHGLGGDSVGRRSRAIELLDLVGLLPEHANRYPHEFSGGQRQRIGIARALSVEPSFIVCDEAVSALDVSVQAQVLNLLADLKDRLGLTYLFIAHDLAVVEHVCDRVAVMYLGRVVEMASAEDLYRDPRHPYTKALLSAAPRPDPKAKSGAERMMLTGEPPSPMNPPPGCAFHPRCPHAEKDEECRRAVPALEQGEGRFLACIKESTRVGDGA